VNILRFLRPACIKLRLDFAPAEGLPDESEATRAARHRREKETLLAELAELLAASGEISSLSKFTRDLSQRERKATTAIAPGIAIPHVRSYQARSFVIGLARADPPGVDFDSLDGEPTRLFVLLTSPPWDDRTYLAVYREFAALVQDETALDGLMSAHSEQDVFNTLRAFFR
jgi:fructose PTS system EIIBC or EIIC component